MTTINLKTTTGKSLGQIDFPENPSEVTLSQYVDFQAAFETLENWRKENDGQDFNSFSYRRGELQKMIACVAAFIGKDISTLPVGRFLSRRDLDFETSEVTINSLFNAIQVVMSRYKCGLPEPKMDTVASRMNQYQNWFSRLKIIIVRHKRRRNQVHLFYPKRASVKNIATSYLDYWFNYNGKKYVLPSMYRDAITNQEKFESVATAQAVEALTKWEIYQRNFKAGLVDTGFTFSIILLIIATFAQADGDQFPDTDPEIDRYISDRVVYFKNVDMQVGLDVLAFFFVGTHPLKQTQVSSFSLSRPKSRPKTSMKWTLGQRRG